KLRTKSPVWFGKQMTDRFEKGRVSGKGRTCYYGLHLETTEFQPPAADNPSQPPTTLHNPSQPIEMPNKPPVEGELTRFCEGLQPIHKSIIEKNSPRVDLLDYPSHPSHPSHPSQEQVLPSPPPFVPTDDWQEVPEGAVCPPGLEY